MKQGTAAWTKSEITKADLRLTDLESKRDRLEQARKALLLVDDDRDHRVVSAIENGMPPGELFIVHDPSARRLLESWSGRGLGAIRHEVAELSERRELLEEQLPSEEEVAAAEKQADPLVKRTTEQSERFAKSWSAYITALKEAETMARQVAATLIEAQATIHDLLELREQYGIEVEVPREPRPDLADSKFAGLVGSLLRDVGHSQVIDRGLEAEVASARRQVEREAA